MMGGVMFQFFNPRFVLGGVRLRAPVALAIAALIGGASMIDAAGATPPGLSTYASPLRQNASAPKVALIIVPDAASRAPRWAIAHADEEAYRKRLLDLGFDVSVIGPSDRLELDRLLRDNASRIASGSDVAVLVLGAALSSDDDVRLVPTDAPADLIDRPDQLEAETVRLSEVLRRIAGRSPRNLVAIVDECRRLGEGDRACAVEGAASPREASVIAARRKTARPGTSPLIARASLRDDLLPLLSQEGLTFADLHSALVQKLGPTNLTIDATSTLTGAFALVPGGFFAGLATECNKVDLNADPVALKAASLDGLQRSCDAAASQYPYARHFVDRQSAVKEQRAFQRAVASCADTVAISGFATAYPASRFRRVVEDFSLACARERDDARLQREAQERDRALRDAQERDRLQREAQERERALREAQERDRAQREAQERAAQETQSAQRVIQQIAQTFVSRYYWTSSSDGESAGARLADLYAPVVSFYGRQRTAPDIMAEKLAYNARWPVRRFLIRPGSVAAVCDASSGGCRVTGMVEFDFESAARNVRSRGLSSFEFVVGNMMSSPRVVGEQSKVEQRF